MRRHRLPRLVTLLLVALPLAAAPADAGQARAVRRAGPPPPVRTSGAVAASAMPAGQLVLPYFLLNTENPAGVRTFLSVRNNDVLEAYSFELQLRTPEHSLLVYYDVEPFQLKTINLQSFAHDLEVPGSDVSLGYGLVTMVDPVTHQPLPSPPDVLHGDFFVMDPANAFASGDLLVDAETPCEWWGTRFFNGGGFTGGTTIVLTVPAGVAPPTPVAVGHVYNEAGVFQDTYEIVSDDEVILLDSLSSFEPPLPVPFGVIEWELGQNGWAQVTFDALGEYSVGTSAFCICTTC